MFDRIVWEGPCLCGTVATIADCRQSSGNAFTMFAVWLDSVGKGKGSLHRTASAVPVHAPS